MVVEGETLKKIGEHPSRSLGFLSRYHDGELTREEAAEFDRHAEHCAECRSAAAEYEAVLAMYRSAGTEIPDDRLAARIARRIDTEVRGRAPVRFITLQIDLLWASVLAVALVGALALYAVLSRRPPGPVTVAENSAPASPAPHAPEIARVPESVVPVPSAERPKRRGRTSPSSTPLERPAPPPADAPFAPEPDHDSSAGVGATSPAPTAPAAEAKAVGGAAEMASADASRQEALPVGGPVSDPVLIRRVEPVVSEDARKRIAGGSPVVIVAVISEEGEVTRPRIVRSNPALDGAVLRAVRQWRYRPALKDGKPVAAYLTITVNADLR